jgi:UDP-glucose 4-epimerase
MGKGERWLVTGASGFVGSALSQAIIEQGGRVRALSRRSRPGPWDEEVLCDLGTDPIPEAACEGVSGIFHLAGIAHTPDSLRVPDADYWRVNLEGTRSLIAAAEAAGVAGLVYFSSVKATADPGAHCVDEGWNDPPADAYGLSKRRAEDLVLGAHARSGMHAVVLRPTLVYGPGVKGNLQRMLTAVAQGRFPPIAESGNRRSMVSVSDLVAAAWLVMRRDQAAGRRYLVADGVDYSTRFIYEAMSEVLGRPLPGWSVPLSVLRLGGQAGDVIERLARRRFPLNGAVVRRLTGSACYRADRLRAELGWAPDDNLTSLLPMMVSRAREDGLL